MKKTMSRRIVTLTGVTLVVLGLCLLSLSVVSHVKLARENSAAVENAKHVMSVLRPLISDAATDTATDAPPQNTDAPATDPDIYTTDADAPPSAQPTGEMPTVTVDGFAYMGYLTFPSLDLELPVMASWDYDMLTLAPCRHNGTVEERNLVIAGHNYDDCFGRITLLTEGSPVFFTDVLGNIYGYTVSHTEIIHMDNVTAMLDPAPGLTLYTCTYSGAERYTVRCAPQE